MSGQPSRSYLIIAAAIVIVGVLISASLFFAVGVSPAIKTTTFTSFATVTSAVTSTVTSTVIGTPVSSTSARVYAVTFQQVRDCGQYNIMPWAVTIDGLTAVQPSNQSLPLPTNYFSTRVSNQNLTRITLFVPPGSYDYTLSGGAEMGGGFYPTSGTIVVSGLDVVVNVEIWLSITCTSTTTSTP